MRRFNHRSTSTATALLLVALGGCKSADSAPGAGKPCVMRSGGQPVLLIQAPANATCTMREGALTVDSRDYFVEFWLVRNTSSLDSAAGRVSDTIKDEFKDFKPTQTRAFTVADAPAKRLAGTGAEADDGDPGTADVVVFAVGGRFFIACTHGEHLSPKAQTLMESLLATAKAP